MTDNVQLESLIKKVQANQKYQSINRDLVRRLCNEAIAKGKSEKLAVKAVRNKLHQIGGAYFKQKVDYLEAKNALSDLPKDFRSEELKQYCIKMLGQHTSTAERLPILEAFYTACLEPIAPVTSLIDLACGMNPFGLPWMPLARRFSYDACDIYEDMLGLIGSFFDHLNIKGHTQPCDLVAEVPKKTAQVALLLKSIPCLEQVDKTIGIRLLDKINTEHILVSFPVRSLSGREKGMPDFYREHFYGIADTKNWKIQEFEFSTELAFLVTK